MDFFPTQLAQASAAPSFENEDAIVSLKAYVASELKRGVTAEKLAQELQRSGYTQAQIAKVIALQAKPQANAGFAFRNVYEIDERRISLAASRNSPRIAVFDSFLGVREAAQLIEAARGKLDRALVVDAATGKNIRDEARSCDAAYFQRNELPLISAIENRIAQLTGVGAHYGEGLQVLRYTPGGQYQPHHDFFDENTKGGKAQIKHAGQRIGTFIMYLNTVSAGGATRFVSADFDVYPRLGSALYFAYAGGEAENHATLHASLPLISGEKWIATKWLRNKVQL